MEISKQDLIRINEGFGGTLRNEASLDFAIDKQRDKKIGELKKLAYLFRAILVDHPFSDGNKRTATFLAFEFADKNKKEVDTDILKHQIVSISKKNLNEIEKIKQRLKTCIK